MFEITDGQKMIGRGQFTELPEWWRDCIKEFENHNLPSYQPPQFNDGRYTYKVVDKLQAKFDISVRFVGVGVKYGDDWTVFVDREPVGEIGRYRNPRGYTVYDMSSQRFEMWIESVVG